MITAQYSCPEVGAKTAFLAASAAMLKNFWLFMLNDLDTPMLETDSLSLTPTSESRSKMSMDFGYLLHSCTRSVIASMALLSS